MKVSRQIAVSYKGLHAIIDAVVSKLAWYEQEIARCAAEDEVSDLENDAALLRTELDQLKKEASKWAVELAREQGR
jgi:hypothetical protein